MFKAAGKKEADALDDLARISAGVYTSEAKIPLQGVCVIFTRNGQNGKRELLAVQLSNYDGLTDVISMQAPPPENSQTLSPGAQAYATVDVTAEQPGYGRTLVQGVQLFSGAQSVQEFMLVPSATLPQQYERTQVFTIEPQTLQEV